MNMKLHLALVAMAACLYIVDGAPDVRVGRTKQQRPTRGFKTMEMLTARAFGKRDKPYGAENFWESLESQQEKEQQDNTIKIESIPLDWFVSEMMNNPDFARLVVRKFVDIDQDGMLSPEELLRNV